VDGQRRVQSRVHAGARRVHAARRRMPGGKVGVDYPLAPAD